MAKRPGIVIYFDIIPALAMMSDEEKGKMFMGMLEYGQYGVVPELKEEKLAMAWTFLQPKLDFDDSKYKQRCLKSKYSVYCRWCKQEGVQKPTFAEWLVLNQQAEEMAEEGEFDAIEQ